MNICQRFAVIMTSVLLWAGNGFAQKVNVEFDQSADFSRFKTFAIRTGQLNSKDPALNSELIRKHIEADITRALTAKGLTAITGRADLNVTYRLGASRVSEVDRYPAGPYGRRVRTVRSAHERGTLIIDLRDGSSRSMVWRAIANEDQKTGADVAHKLDDMVRKSLEKYPPKQKE